MYLADFSLDSGFQLESFVSMYSLNKIYLQSHNEITFTGR
jgi:hypothetical protein